MKMATCVLFLLCMIGCHGIPGMSTNTIQMGDRPNGEPGDFLELAKFDNLIGPSIAVLFCNGEMVEGGIFSETGLIGAVATGAGIATSGYGHDYVGDNISVNASSDGASAGALSGSVAGALSISKSDASAGVINKNTNQQAQGQAQGQLQGQKQGQIQGQAQGQAQGQKLINKKKRPGHGGGH